MNKNIKRVFAIGAIGVLALGTLAGCTKDPTWEDTKIKFAEQIKAEKDSIDLTTDNQAAIDKYVEDNKLVVAPVVPEEVVVDPIALDLSEEKIIRTPEKFSKDGFYLGDVLGLSLNYRNKAELEKVEIEFDGDDYTAIETLQVNGKLAYNSMDGLSRYRGLKGPSVILEKGDLRYFYDFKDKIDWSKVSEEKSFEIPNFLGYKIKVIEAKEDENEITVAMGLNQHVVEGQKFLAGDRTLEILSIAGDRVRVSVDGIQETIKQGETPKKVNGLELYAEDVFDEDGEADEAYLKIGNDIKMIMKNGEPLEIAGFSEDNDKYVYDIDLSEGIIGAKNNFRADEFDEEVIKVGEDYITPFGKIAIQSSEVESSDYEFELETEDFGGDVVNGVKITGNFEYDDGSEETKEVFYNGVSLFVKEYNNWVVKTDIKLSNSEKRLMLQDGNLNGLIVENTILTNLELNLIQYYDGAGFLDANNIEENLLLKNGASLESPKDNIEDNRISLKDVEEQPEFNIIVE